MTVTAVSLLSPGERDLLARQGGGEKEARQIISERVGPASFTKDEILARIDAAAEEPVDEVVVEPTEQEPVDELASVFALGSDDEIEAALDALEKES